MFKGFKLSSHNLNVIEWSARGCIFSDYPARDKNFFNLLARHLKSSPTTVLHHPKLIHRELWYLTWFRNYGDLFCLFNRHVLFIF
jgi:hypothetical protein